MLMAMRSGAASWIIKGLLVLLLAGFVIWGIGDVPLVSQDRAVAEIAGRDVTASELDKEFRDLLRQVQRRTGLSMDVAEARKGPLLQTALNQIVTRRLLDLEARRLYLAAGDESVRARITATPAFAGPGGGFDRIRFERILRDNDLTEGAYVAMARVDLLREQLQASLIGAVQLPQGLADRVFAWQGERRSAELLVIDSTKLPDPASPDEATLAAFHKAGADRYKAPEFRAVTLLRITPDSVAHEIAVTEDEVRAEFEANAANLGRPERRTLRQVVLADKPQAEALVARLKKGEDFVRAARDISKQPEEALHLGVKTKADLPPELAEAAFALPKGGSSAPVQTAFGWHVLQAAEIEPGEAADFAKLRPEMEKRVRQAKALDVMYPLAGKVEDGRAGGESLAEIGKRLSLPVLTVEAIDVLGKGRDGKPVAGWPADPALLDDAFALAEGADSPMRETESGEMAFMTLNGVIPAALRPLDEIRAQVLADWKADEKRKVAKATADRLLEVAKGGADLAKLAAKEKLIHRTSEALTRAEAGKDAMISAELLAKIFTLKPGEAATGLSAEGSAAVVARLAAIQPASRDKDGPLHDAVQRSLAQGLAGDILALYDKDMRRRHKVSINGAALAQLPPS